MMDNPVSHLLISFLVVITLCFHVHSQNFIDVKVDVSTGSYSLQVKNTTWLESGDYAVHFGGEWYSTANNSLKLQSSTVSGGTDKLGKFQETTLTWSAGTASWLTSIKTYSPQPFVVFTQSFPETLTDTAIGNNNEIISGFPTFKLSAAPELHYYSYHSTFAYAQTGVWGPDTDVTAGVEGGVPLVLFNSELTTLMISPLDNFMIGIQTLSKQLNHQLACGPQGKIKTIPKGFSHSTIITASEGVNQAFTFWGNLLSQFYGKKPKTPEDDFVVKTLGYWTDNGAYYYYLTEPGKNYADTVIDVYNYVSSTGLPVQYYQFDSWWYLRGSTSGLLLWEPRADVFPAGMKAVQEQMGSKPLILHNRWFENDNYYSTKMGFPFIVEDKNGYALPLTEEPYVYFMTKAKEWGMISYEQDWLVDQFLNMEATQDNVTNAKNWMLNMDLAARKVGVTIQLCMPLPGHILQSVAMDSVTQIRASGDYQRQIYDRNQWAVGYSSMLIHAMGAFPFKDCFWSSNATQSDCVAKVCHEPNALLETLSATLTAGPVAPADKIGFLDAKNLMQTCQADGILLKPDVPAKTMDLVFSTGFIINQIRLDNLSSTYSQHTFHIDQESKQASWYYILAANTETTYTITPEDIGEPKASFLVYDYFGESVKLSTFDATHPLVIPPLYNPNSEPVTFKYYILVPLVDVGTLPPFTFIGESNKFIVASYQRFDTISLSFEAQFMLKVNINGAPSEQVHLQLWHEATQSIVSVVCTLDKQGTATLSCLDSAGSCTCQ